MSQPGDWRTAPLPKCPRCGCTVIESMPASLSKHVCPTIERPISKANGQQKAPVAGRRPREK